MSRGADEFDMNRWAAVIWIAFGALLVLVVNLTVLVRGDLDGAVAASGTPQATDEGEGGAASSGEETLEQQIERVAADVAELREMRFEQVPEPRLINPVDLAARVEQLIDEYTEEEADVDRRILATLGAVPDDVDLRSLLRDALSEQVAGFYDPETEELVVVSTGDGSRLGPMGEITLAHELDHALVDQVIGLPHEPEVPEGAEDRALAEAALVEGDATLLMIQYAQSHLASDDSTELFSEGTELMGRSEALDALPHYVARSLLFPYEEGLRYAAALYSERGWFGVDEALRSPPPSTLAVLDPARYLRGEVEPVEVPDPSGPEGWERRTQRSFGAADLLFLFEAPGGEPERELDDPTAAATRWRGGQIGLFEQDGRDGVAIVLSADEGLCEAAVEWYDASFTDDRRDGRNRAWDGAERAAVIECGEDAVRIGVGPDREAAAALAAG